MRKTVQITVSNLTKFISRVDLQNAKVDREKRVIKGVSICSIGEAKGHNKSCDRTTLEQLRECAREYDGGLRVRFNPNTFAHTEATLIGFIPNESMRMRGNRLVGDLHVYEHAPHTDYLYELAEKSPDLFGLSVEFSGVDEEKDGETFARCNEILAATIVDLPAANPTGLFAAKDDDGKKPYGDVEYADPGYQEDGKKRYPIDTEAHCRAAWSYINKQSNAAQYSGKQLANIKSRIKAAAKKHGVEISEDQKESRVMSDEELVTLSQNIKNLTGVVERLTNFFAAGDGDGNGDGDGKKKKTDEEEPDEEEMRAAGVADGDDHDTKMQKVRAYRKGIVAVKKTVIATPGEKDMRRLLREELMQFFRKTGTKQPARESGGGDGARSADSDFEAIIDNEIEKGAKSRGRAILLARRRDGAAYNSWMRKRYNTVREE